MGTFKLIKADHTVFEAIISNRLLEISQK